MANLGNYQAAIDLFTQAINLDAKDFRFVCLLVCLLACLFACSLTCLCVCFFAPKHIRVEKSILLALEKSSHFSFVLFLCRFFGNRSYCYDRMGQYEKALQDADVAISLAPDWPKGYFRRGRALAGLKVLVSIMEIAQITFAILRGSWEIFKNYCLVNNKIIIVNFLFSYILMQRVVLLKF